MKIITGIDGGGTKTDFVATDEKGRIIKRIIKGSSNPIDIGAEKAVQVLVDGISDLGVKPTHLFAGLSGGISGDNKEKIYKGLKDGIGEDVCISNGTDAVNVLNCGLIKGAKAVVISGTGSVCFVRKGNDLVRIGGWGYLIDKGAGGYDFGREALYYALCDLDGRGEHTLITDLANAKAGGIVENLGKIYSEGKPYIASFAPIVFEAYAQGDKIAEEIIKQNATEYAKLINRAWEVNGEDECTVVLGGSMFKQWHVLQKFIQPLLKYKTNFVLADMPPVYGAVLEAALGADVDIDTFDKTLREELANEA